MNAARRGIGDLGSRVCDDLGSRVCDARRPMAEATGSTTAMAVALVWAALSAVPASAQKDFRSADLDRPVRVEDAGVIEMREWELELGSRAAFAEGPVRELEALFELKTGILPNTQLGVELEGVLESVGGVVGGTGTGIEGAGLHLLYGVARETPSLPALAVRLDVVSPGLGTLGNERAQLGIKGMATRSLGRARIHANGGYVVAGDVDGGDYWRLGLGTDYPIGLFSRAILADVYAELPKAVGADSRIWLDLGARFQVTNLSVIDVGIATRVDQWQDDRANLEMTLGFSRVFGFEPDVPPYPDPSIR